MGAASNSAVRIAILADGKQARREMDQTAKSGDGLGSKLANIGKGLAVGGAVAGLALLTGKVKGAFDALNEQDQLLGQTNAVLKSTGAAAGISAQGVVDLAGAIEKKSKLDAEAIQSGENLLLTFTNIKNGAGEGNDIFNQTTQIMADMATAMGQDPKTAAIGLGKALNDPIKGVTALSKVGVSFTEDQKKQIKTLQESGNVMGAQKLILAELNKEFGGSAQAASDSASGQWKHLNDAIDDVFETVVKKALPTISKLVAFLAENLPKAIDAVSPAAKTFEQALGKAFDVLGKLLGFVAKNKDFFVPFAATILAVVAAVKIWTAVQTVLNVVLAANPLGLLVIAIAALVGGLVFAFKHSEKFRNALRTLGNIAKAVGTAIKTGLGAVIDWFSENWKKLPLLLLGPIGLALIIFKDLPGKIVDAVGDLAKTLYNKGRSLIIGLKDGINSYAGKVADFFVGLAKSVAKWVGNLGKTLYDKGRSLIIGLKTGINSYLSNVFGFFSGLAREVVRHIGNVGRALYNTGRALLIGLKTGINSYVLPIATFWTGLAGTVLRWVGNMASTLHDKGRSLIIGLKAGINSYVSSVSGFFTGLAGSILRWVGDLGKTLYNAGKAIIQGLIDGLASKVGDLKNWLKNNITDKMPDWKGPLPKDKKLLTPAGQAIISGLIAGMDSETDRLRRFLGGVSSDIESGISASPSVRLDASVALGNGARGAAQSVAPTINVYALTDGPEVGRRVAQALKEYTSINGPIAGIAKT